MSDFLGSEIFANLGMTGTGSVAYTNPQLVTAGNLNAGDIFYIDRQVQQGLTSAQQAALDIGRATYGESWYNLRVQEPLVFAIETAAAELGWTDPAKTLTALWALGDPGRKALAATSINTSGSTGPNREQNIANLTAEITNIAGQLGAQLSSEAIIQLATEAVDNKYDSALITDKLIDQAKLSDFLPGETTANITLIKGNAARYGIELSDEDARNLAVRYASGEITDAGIEQYIRQKAIEADPTAAPYINLGITVTEFNSNKNLLKTLSTNMGVPISDDQLDTLTTRIISGEMTEDQVRKEILSFVTDPRQLQAGEITANADTLRANASQYLSFFDDATARNYALRIAKGEITEESVMDIAKDSARSRFGFAANAIDRGLTVTDYLRPNIQTLADIWEVGFDDIDLSDTNMLGFLVADDGTPNARAMTFGETARAARADRRWLETQSSRDSLSNMSLAISRIMGRSGI